MGFPKLVTTSKLDSMRQAEEDRIKRWEEVNYDPATHVASDVDKRHRQERWLGVFEKCLSPALACKQSGVPMSAYRKWRGGDLWFAEQLNSIMHDWRDELMSSAVTRAIGRTHEDKENGGLLRDASGKIVYTDGSDTLARQLLNMDADVPGGGAGIPVIQIDLVAFGFSEEHAGNVVIKKDGATNSHVIEGDFTEVDSDPPAAA